jgi:hypothetical protein
MGVWVRVGGGGRESETDEGEGVVVYTIVSGDAWKQQNTYLMQRK